MSNSLRFDYSREHATRLHVLDLLHNFASRSEYRSATVEELILKQNEYRRPLRVEDLSFLEFSEPVSETSTSMLPSLASNRMLFCLNELRSRTPSADEDANNQKQRNFLESVAFTYACRKNQENNSNAIHGFDIDELFRKRLSGYHALLGRLAKRQFVKEGLSFALLQHCGPREISSALARHTFSSIGLSETFDIDCTSLVEGSSQVTDFLSQLSKILNLSPLPQAHWQFYLATSLSRANLIGSLSVNKTDVFMLLGAVFAMNADFIAFVNFATNATRMLPECVYNSLPDLDIEFQKRQFDRAIASVEKHCGHEGVRSLKIGFALGREISDAAFQDLTAQLNWLSGIDTFLVAAKLISSRIEMEWPDIDRDTFVEPQEMCSTTHVHDDHRLVMVESGDMIFWGRPEMELRLTVGDKVLIPAGRLHGSTVTSDVCTYHQPIIPEKWVRDTFDVIRSQDSLNMEKAR